MADAIISLAYGEYVDPKTGKKTVLLELTNRGKEPFDLPSHAPGHGRDCGAVPGSAARAKRISAESECEPVFFMTAARWFSTVRWLMPRSAAMFLLGWPVSTSFMI